MRRKVFITCMVVVFLFSLGPLIAEENIPDLINFTGDPEGGASEEIYPSSYTGEVVFQHTKHAKEYSEGCAACHHDSSMEPIEAYDSDETYTCIDCHDGEGYIRGPIAENTYDVGDLITYRANVIHHVCINCHKEHNAQKHSIIAPEACRMCHEKRAVDYTMK